MKTANFLLTAGFIGIAGYILYKELLKPRLAPVEVENRLSSFAKKDELVYKGTHEPENVFYQTKTGDTVTTYSFGKGDYERLNFAQRFLLSTKLVPTRWILG